MTPGEVTENALQKSEERFRRYFELGLIGMAITSPTKGCLEVNDEICRILGYERAELLRMTWADLTHPDDLAADVANFNRVLAGEIDGYSMEKRFLRKDGQVVDTRVSVKCLRRADGSVDYFVALLQDITERKRSEQALRESDERFRELAENIDEVFWLGDLQPRKVLYINPAYEKIWGRSRESLYASPKSWTEALHPEDRERILAILADGRLQVPGEMTYRIARPDGTIRWIRSRGSPVKDADGKVVRVAGIDEDITERKLAEEALRESEERFRELAENIDAVVWLSDPQHKEVFYISPAYERIWGRTRASLYASTRSWTEALHPDDRERILARRADEHFQEMPDMTYRIVRPDGSLRWIHSREFPVKDVDGKIVRVAGIVEDITERKRVELALDERLRFETLLTELSAAFANLPTTTVDREIDKWLQNLVEFLDLDRAIFDQVGEDGMTLSLTHSHTVRGIDVFPVNGAGDQAPWIIEQLLLGNTVKWSRIPDDIPQQAWKEREFAGRIGAKSLLSIPVCIGGSVICAVSFTSLRIYRDWSDEVVARLRLVGEIFANAIARKRASKELEEANHQLRFLSRRLFHLQEEERRHLARELHDEIGQALTGAKINLDAAMKELDGAKSKRIDETAAILEKLLGQVRQISLDLRPSTLDDLGLVPALRSLLDQQGRRASVAVHLSAKNVPENLDPEIQTTCFRITQEAITNTVRHANATRINVQLGCENGNLRLQVCDNGMGFDADSAQSQAVGLGLIGIKERAALVGGWAKIISSPNKGTTVEVSLPLTFPAKQENRKIGG